MAGLTPTTTAATMEISCMVLLIVVAEKMAPFNRMFFEGDPSLSLPYTEEGDTWVSAKWLVALTLVLPHCLVGRMASE
jgi:hypothetical protein